MRLVPVPALLLFASLTGIDAHAATGPADTGVELSCLSLQYREGAVAYRECLAGTDGAGERAPSDTLSFDERHAIERACAATPGDERCAATRIAALEAAPAPSLDALDAADRRAIRRQCTGERAADGASGYRRCLDDALDALAALPEPDLGALALPERSALDLRCAAGRDTAADYRRCLLESLGVDVGTTTAGTAATIGPAGNDEGSPPAEEVPSDVDVAADADAATDTTLPEPLSVETTTNGATAPENGLAAPEPAAGETTTDDATAPENGLAAPEPVAGETTTDGATAPENGLAAPEPATGETTTDDGAITDVPPVDEPVALAPTTTEGPGSAVTDPSAASGNAPALGAAEPSEDPTAGDPAADALDAAGERPPPDVRQRMDDARTRLLATIDGLDSTERAVFAAALALPLLLLAFWAAGRGTRSSRPVAVEPGGSLRNAALVERVAPSMRGGGPWEDEDARDVADDDFLGDLDADDTTPDALERDRAAFVAFDDGDLFDDDPDPRGRGPAGESLDDTLPHDVSADFTPRSAFGRRLLAGDSPLERRHAIEFLIYWMAYGDERYEPEARTALLAGGDDGDPQALIKRHVLEEDTQAFADTVRWLQSRCGELERVQIVDLLMALLVGEGAMTPAQNTLLHFLADAFGLGTEGLDRRHEEAFGRPMPALARVDLDAWWERVEPDRTPLWDAHAVAALDQQEQDRVRLGLPLTGEVDDTAIVEAFRRAARRCQPHRFDALGERERALAERQFFKHEEARDRLLGVETVGVGA